jgi:ribosomal protein S11
LLKTTSKFFYQLAASRATQKQLDNLVALAQLTMVLDANAAKQQTNQILNCDDGTDDMISLLSSRTPTKKNVCLRS